MGFALTVVMASIACVMASMAVKAVIFGGSFTVSSGSSMAMSGVQKGWPTATFALAISFNTTMA